MLIIIQYIFYRSPTFPSGCCLVANLIYGMCLVHDLVMTRARTNITINNISQKSSELIFGMSESNIFHHFVFKNEILISLDTYFIPSKISKPHYDISKYKFASDEYRFH